MATLLTGGTVSSTWQGFCTYTVADTNATTYTVTVNSIGIYIIGSTYSLKQRSGGVVSYAIGNIDGISMPSAGKTGSATCGTYKAVGAHTIWSPNYSFTIPKRTTEFKTHLDVTFSCSKWYQYKNSTKKIKTTHDSDDSLMQIPITIPAVPKPTCSFTVERGAKDTSGTYPMNVSVTINSFSGDSIGHIHLFEGSSTVPITTEWKNGDTVVVFPVTMPTTGSLTLTTTLNGYTDGSKIFKCSAYGSGGESSQMSFEVPAAFMTFQMKAGGKGIAIGQKAEEDNFTCSMDAIFKQNLILKSSTAGSIKKFKITVDDSGKISATEITS